MIIGARVSFVYAECAWSAHALNDEVEIGQLARRTIAQRSRGGAQSQSSLDDIPALRKSRDENSPMPIGSRQSRPFDIGQTVRRAKDTTRDWSLPSLDKAPPAYLFNCDNDNPWYIDAR